MKRYNESGNTTRKYYETQLRELQEELVKLQEWIRREGLQVVVLFEGRDAAGKGGTIKRIVQRLNPRVVKVVALGVPTEREKGQWYFQRYVPYLPTKGEMVLFDRSWYNRAGVERVMGFCTDDEYREFLKSCPEFERLLVRSGIILIKYWFSVSAEEQERRFGNRMRDVRKRWKISPMDEEARQRWVEYSKAKDAMLTYTDIPEARWHMVNADVKKHARLNCIRHLLSLIPYDDVLPPPAELPPRKKAVDDYERPPLEQLEWVPEVYGRGPGNEEEIRRLLEKRQGISEQLAELNDEIEGALLPTIPAVAADEKKAVRPAGSTAEKKPARPAKKGKPKSSPSSDGKVQSKG